mmetsp:Transcript_147869/g.474716  ORF Transcript_147869/g.474716 Transcript_147869/m.474716 type:complete len:409 (+) Transcript_147869:96-1322(+)
MLDADVAERNLVVAVGGFDGKEAQRGVQFLDLQDGQWLPGPEMSFGRRDFGVAIVGLDIFVVGGYTESNGCLDDLEYLNVAYGQWRQLPPMPTKRCGMGVVEIGGKIYVTGGRGNGRLIEVTEVYDPEDVRWDSGPRLPKARTSFGLVPWEGRLYIVGGDIGGFRLATGGGVGIDPINLLDILDIEAQSWEQGPPMRLRRCDLAVVAAKGKVFAIGGYGGRWEGGNYLSCVEIFDVATGQWEAGPPMSLARSGLGAAVHETKIMVLGGPFAGVGVTTLEILDLEVEAPTWREGLPMPGKRWGLRSVLYLGKSDERLKEKEEDAKATARFNLKERMIQADAACENFEQMRRTLACAILKGMSAGLDEVELEAARRLELELSNMPTSRSSTMFELRPTGAAMKIQPIAER